MDGGRHFFNVVGVPVFLHWSIPLGLALASGFGFEPLGWLGWAIVVLGHELGHLALLRWCRVPVYFIGIHGFGGLVAFSGSARPYQRAVVAWGGVLAQLGIFVLAIAFAKLGVVPDYLTASSLYWMLVPVNLLFIIINLIPWEPLDGAMAWRLPRLAWLERSKRRVEDQLLRAATDASPARRTDPTVWN